MVVASARMVSIEKGIRQRKATISIPSLDSPQSAVRVWGTLEKPRALDIGIDPKHPKLVVDVTRQQAKARISVQVRDPGLMRIKVVSEGAEVRLERSKHQIKPNKETITILEQVAEALRLASPLRTNEGGHDFSDAYCAVRSFLRSNVKSNSFAV